MMVAMNIRTVEPRIAVGEEVIQLSTLDQQASRRYVDNLLIFEYSDKDETNDVVQRLEQALAATLCEIPDFAATIVPLLDSEKRELELRIGPTSGVPLRILHHDDATEADARSPLSGRSYSDLAKENFPFRSEYNSFLFVPRVGFEDASLQGLPVLLIQINLVQGGVFIGISFHHTLCDGHSMDYFLKSWALNTKTSMSQGVTGSMVFPRCEPCERWRLSHGSSNVTITELPEYIIESSRRNLLQRKVPHLLDYEDIADLIPSTWYLSMDALNSLRGALRDASGTQTSRHFTNSEAVSALIWKHLSLARSLGKLSPENTSLFATRIDFRSRAKPTFRDSYIGNINEPHARVRMPLSEVCAPSTPKSLAILAMGISDAVTSLDEKMMRDFIGLIEASPTVTDLVLDADTFPGPDLIVTDTSSLQTLHYDWGKELGQPVSIRTGFREKGVVVLSPQDQSGGFEVQLNCSGIALANLKVDDLFVKYAKFRC